MSEPETGHRFHHYLAFGLLAASSFAGACGGSGAERQINSTPPRPVAAEATVPHGNHDPKYGGVVLMNGDLHFEVVLRREGRHQVYFSDAQREELPASFASSVTVTVSRDGSTPETVPLQIDDSGESWVGHGRPIDDPPHATARVTYTAQGEPYWIDVPFETKTTAGR